MSSRNRLAELQNAAAAAGKDLSAVDNTPASFEQSSDQVFMSDFFNSVKEIRENMAKIEELKTEISDQHEHLLTLVSQKEAQKESQQIDDKTQEVTVLATKIRNTLKTIDKQTKQEINRLKELHASNEDGAASADPHNADIRIRENQHQVLSRKFLNIMKEYNEQQASHKQKYRDRVERQFKIVQPNATPEEVEKVLSSENTKGIFADQITTSKEEEQKLLEDIEDRHKDIMRLEKSLKELHDLFLDMALLVEQQGEMLDRIEFNVNGAAEYVAEAKKELKTARKYQKSARKLQICCLLLLLILILIIVVPIVLTHI